MFGAKKNRIITISAIALIIALVGALSGCVTKYKLRDPEGIPTAFARDIVNNLDISSRDTALLDNPDRGFRGEMYLTLGKNVAYPSSHDDPYAQIALERDYEGTKVNVIQTYVYLIEYYDKDLTQDALEEMKKFFLAVKDSGAKMLLRFAYEYTANDRRGVTTSQIIRHCAQLKEWFNANIELAYDTIYSMQLGMIGLWGEGHSAVKKHNVAEIIKAVDDMTPPKLNIMVRTPEFLDQAPKSNRERFTVHDDFLVGEDHAWGMLDFEHPQYKQLCDISATSLSDGEMPWGRDNTVENIDKMGFLRQIKQYGLTTLSIKHNYMEVGECQEYELYKWRQEYLTKQTLEENNLPYNQYMLDGDKISVFEYINYHLGYQLALSNYLNIESAGGGIIQLIINNYGLAAPIGYRVEAFVNGEKVDINGDQNLANLYQFSQKVINIPYRGEVKSLGIRIVSERDGSVIKVANNLAYENGVNIVK